MSTFTQCETQAKLIGKKFHELIKKDNSVQQKFYLEYPDLKSFNIHSPILVLGLNPSGEDDLKIGRTSTNLFAYIPSNPTLVETPLINQYIELQKFCYTPYFKTFIETFQQFKPPYNPVWYNHQVLKGIFEDYDKHLSPELLNYFNGFPDNGNYIVFADLIQYSRTNSKDITVHLSDISVITLIKDYINLLFDFIKPKLVLVANASVSHFLINNFNDGTLVTHFKLNETTVFLGSMLTGQRAMDIYSRERLMNEIKNHLK
jgi:hypothetical protein